MENKFQLNGKFLTVKELEIEFCEIGSFVKEYFSDSNSYDVYTSGSTGKPKKISIPKAYMKASAQKTLRALVINPGDSCLLCLPTDRIGGIMMLVRWLEGNLDLYVATPEATPLNNFSREFDFAAMVPYQVEHSIDKIEKVKKLIIGGAAISGDLEEKLKTKSTLVYHTYGMTETISHVALRNLKGENPNVFEALPEVTFATDNRGCLIINAPDIGVQSLVTNDVVELQDSKSFIWKGRIDNVVNSGGVKLYPEDIEQKIGGIGFPFFLFAIPDQKLGEKLVMLVEARGILSIEQFKRSFESLSKYEKPKKVFTISKFIKTAGDKLDRKATVRAFRASFPKD